MQALQKNLNHPSMNHLLRDTLRLIKFVRQYFLESLRSADGVFTGCDFFLRAEYIPERNIWRSFIAPGAGVRTVKKKGCSLLKTSRNWLSSSDVKNTPRGKTISQLTQCETHANTERTCRSFTQWSRPDWELNLGPFCETTLLTAKPQWRPRLFL